MKKIHYHWKYDLDLEYAKLNLTGLIKLGLLENKNTFREDLSIKNFRLKFFLAFEKKMKYILSGIKFIHRSFPEILIKFNDCMK